MNVGFEEVLLVGKYVNFQAVYWQQYLGPVVFWAKQRTDFQPPAEALASGEPTARELLFGAYM